MTDETQNYFSNDCHVSKTARLEAPVRLYGHAEVDNKVKLGKYTYIQTRSTVNSDTQIGRYCSVGKNCEIGAFDHPLMWLSTSPVSYNAHLHFPNEKNNFIKVKLTRASGAVIGNDVWVGSNVVILRGVIIGDGAVIGAGSVVTKDVEPYAIVAGSPAKKIRKRFDDKTIERLLATKWWDRPTTVVAMLDFTDVEATLAKLEELDATAHLSDDSATTASVTNSKESLIDGLSEQIKAIEDGAKKPVPEAKQAFAESLAQSFEAMHAPDSLLELIRANASRLFSEYDVSDPYDQAALKNKIAHISTLLPNSDTEDLPKGLKNTILNILSTKQ